MTRPELVPGPRWSPPTEIEHVLVVTGGDGYDPDYEVEHPPECGRACFWWPGAAAEVEHPLAHSYWGDGHPTCYVQYEIEACGLDSLHGEAYGIELADYGEWQKLPPGRYRISGWYTPPGWAGPNPIDADGGLSLLGPEHFRPWDHLRRTQLAAYRRGLRARLRHQTWSVRVRGRRVSLRGPRLRAYYSERNQHGCKVYPLGRGWRLVVEDRR